MAQKKKQLVAEGKLDKHGRPNENTPKEYLRSLPDVAAAKVSCLHCFTVSCLVIDTHASHREYNWHACTDM